MTDLPAFLHERARTGAPSSNGPAVRTPILEKGCRNVAELIRDSYMQWECARRDGLLQGLDPRVKVAFMAVFLVVISLKRTLLPQAGIGIGIALLMAVSHLDLATIHRRVAWSTLLFGVLIPLPSLLNLFGKDTLLFPLLHLGQEQQLWHYRIPATIGITTGGMHNMALLTLRIGNSLALSQLVLHTTPLPELIKALRIYRVPDSFIMIISLSYKYVFAFSQSVLDMHLAKKSRLLGAMTAVQSRQWAAGRIAVLFHKSQRRCEEIHKAMMARGLGNDLKLHTLPALVRRDYCAITVMLALCAAILAL